MPNQNPKCQRCGKRVTDNERLAVEGLVIDAARKFVAKTMAEQPEAALDEVREAILDSTVREVPVCLACFEEVNAAMPIDDFLNASALVITPHWSFKQIGPEDE